MCPGTESPILNGILSHRRVQTTRFSGRNDLEIIAISSRDSTLESRAAGRAFEHVERRESDGLIG